VSPLELAEANLLSPVVLAFGLGLVAALVRSDLTIPPGLATGLSLYLLLAIGLKGGVQLAETNAADLWAPVLATLALGVTVPLAVFAVARRPLRLDVPNAASLAAHYGSVSAVTFTAAVTLLESEGVPLEDFLTTLLAVLEVPAIVVALALAHSSLAGGGLRAGLGSTLAGKSVLLLLGGLVIGVLSGPERFAPAEPVFVDAFYGVLVVFLLGLGIAVGQHVGDLRQVGARIVAFGIVAPIGLGSVGVAVGTVAGLDPGGAAVLGVMAASASYIAAPAAVRSALPTASPAISLVPALGITFPLNLTIGIPLCYAVAEALG
jgi:uncharacterized protein